MVLGALIAGSITKPLVGALAGGIANGLITNYQTKKLANAYKEAAQDIREAGKKYSGQAANAAMTQEGARQAQQMQKLAQSQGVAGTTGLSTADATNMTQDQPGLSAYMQGQNLGRSNKATELNSKYNAATVDAQNMLSKANVDYRAGQAATQFGMNALSGIANIAKDIGGLNALGGSGGLSALGGSGGLSASGGSGGLSGLGGLFSDENCKEGINNNSELPNATLGDAMSKLETVIYKYKDETGLDQDCHCGTIAQSLAKEPEFADIVETNEQGVLQLNKDKLLNKMLEMIDNIKGRLDVLHLQGEE